MNRLAALALLPFAALAAEESPVALSPVQVTAARGAEAAFEVPQAVTVLTEAQLEVQSPQVMADLLRGQPGAFVQSSGPGQGIVIVRGLKGSEVLHLVDGFRLNNAFFRNSPSQYIALLDSTNIHQLELVRGPNATIYGSDAMGGVLQILTPEHRFSGMQPGLMGGARVQYNSQDLSKVTRLWAATGYEKFSVSAGVTDGDYGRRKLAELGQSPNGSGGFTMAERVNDTDYTSRGVDFKVLVLPSAQHEFMFSTQHFEIPELQRYFQTVPGFSGGNPARAIAEFNNDRAFYHARYRYKQALGFMENLEVHFGHQVMTDDRQDRRQQNDRDEFTFNRSRLSGITAQAETDLGAHHLRYDVELYSDRVDSRIFRRAVATGVITTPNGTNFFSPFPDGSRADDYGAYLMDEWNINDRWLLDAGLRSTYRKTQIAKGDRAFGAELSDSDITGNVGLRYAITPALAWTTNLGRGFRSPNLFDLAVVGQRANNRVVIANLDLKPESVTSVDTGFKFNGQDWQAEASLFYSDYDDRIETVNPAFAEGTPECPNDGDAATNGCAQNQNITQSRYYGFEGGLRWQAFSKLALRGTLNYTWGDKETGGVKDEGNRVPPLNGLVAVEYRPIPSLRIESSVYFADRQDRLDAGDQADSRINPNGTPGFAVLNLQTIYDLNPHWAFQLDGRNLLDKAYREHGSGIDGAARGVVASVRSEWR